MKYEKTPVSTKPSKVAVKQEVSRELSKHNTSALLWHLVKRHKFGIVVSYAVIISVYYFVPFAPDLVLSLFGK